ncbi:MAG: IS21-like element helper ATPase IstB [Candidatus Sedimenticola sp. 20ELBAFRAG]
MAKLLIEQTLSDLKVKLRMGPMAQAIEDQRCNPDLLAMSFEDRLGMAVQIQVQARETNRLKKRTSEADFTLDACPEDINYRARRGLDRQVMANLLSCDYIEQSLNVIFTGPTGVGKTYIAQALGLQAVRRNYTVRYIRFSTFLEQIELARGDGSLQDLRKELSRKHLLILDDWALSPLTEEGRQQLLEIIDERQGKRSLIITSQLPTSKWHTYLGEPTIGEAILDRILPRSHILKLSGESMRKQMSPLKKAKGRRKGVSNGR